MYKIVAKMYTKINDFCM